MQQKRGNPLIYLIHKMVALPSARETEYPVGDFYM